jgi:hypothetical protein
MYLRREIKKGKIFLFPMIKGWNMQTGLEGKRMNGGE